MCAANRNSGPFLRSSGLPGAGGLLVLVVFLCLLSGCGTILNPGPPPTRLQLNPEFPETVYKTVNKQLIVSLPQAERDLDSERIALLFNGREVKYLSGVVWTTSVPKMLQQDIVDALLASGGLRGVADDMAGIAADAKLQSDLKQFTLAYEDGTSPPTAWIRLTLRLVDLNNGKILATRTVEAKKQASGTETAALVQASEEVLTVALEEVTAWVLEVCAR